MKTPEEIKPNYGPVYAAAMYPELAKICLKHGYALAVHGSLRRDFDLVAIPWVDSVSDPIAVLNEITSTFAVKQTDGGEQRSHGRHAYTLACGWGECFIDISFMPRKS
jgi:hypothetical protein